MREILFKAKRIDNGEWVEGLLTVMWGQYHIINPDNENTAYPIDTETICQYTGLSDKNSNKIWENDIVKCYADTDDLGNDLYFFYKVIWHESYYCWWLSDIHTLEDEYLHQYNSSDIEVIGNIFDNPELMSRTE